MRIREGGGEHGLWRRASNWKENELSPKGWLRLEGDIAETGDVGSDATLHAFGADLSVVT